MDLIFKDVVFMTPLALSSILVDRAKSQAEICHRKKFRSTFNPLVVVEDVSGRIGKEYLRRVRKTWSSNAMTESADAQPVVLVGLAVLLGGGALVEKGSGGRRLSNQEDAENKSIDVHYYVKYTVAYKYIPLG